MTGPSDVVYVCKINLGQIKASMMFSNHLQKCSTDRALYFPV